MTSTDVNTLKPKDKSNYNYYLLDYNVNKDLALYQSRDNLEYIKNPSSIGNFFINISKSKTINDKLQSFNSSVLSLLYFITLILVIGIILIFIIINIYFNIVNISGKSSDYINKLNGKFFNLSKYIVILLLISFGTFYILNFIINRLYVTSKLL